MGSSQITRRSVMKATGSLGSVGFTNKIQFGDLSNTGHRVRLVEVGVVFQGTPQWPVSHTDSFLNYELDVTNERIVFPNWLSDWVNTYLKQQHHLIHGSGFTKVNQYSGRQNSLPISLNKNFSATKYLTLPNPVQVPNVKILKASKDYVKIGAEEDSHRIKQGKSIELSLSEITTEIWERQDEFKTIDDPRGGGTKRVRKPPKKKTQTLEPVVRARHLAPLEVYVEEEKQ